MGKHYTFYSNRLAVESDFQWTANINKYFDTSYVKVTGAGKWLPTSSFTVELWAHINSNRATCAFSIGALTNNRITSHLPWTNNNIYFDSGDLNNCGRLVAAFDNNLHNNVWNHYAFTTDVQNNKMSIYVNGNLYYSENHYNTFKTSEEDFFIGGWDGNNQIYAGNIGECRIWNYAKTATEIQAEMNLCFNSGKPNLLACWRLDDNVSVGGTIKDRSGYNRNGIVIN